MQPDERGQSTTVWFTLVVVALFAVVGLVVDGGAKTAAARRAETVAQAAARAGVDAGAQARAYGRVAPEAALAAARDHLALAGVPGEASMAGTQIVVDTRVGVPTTFLSVLGVTELSATGHARAELRAG